MHPLVSLSFSFQSKLTGLSFLTSHKPYCILHIFVFKRQSEAPLTSKPFVPTQTATVVSTRLQAQIWLEAKLQAQIETLDYIVKPFQPGVPYETYSGKCLDYVCIPREKWEEFEHIIP